LTKKQESGLVSPKASQLKEKCSSEKRTNEKIPIASISIPQVRKLQVSTSKDYSSSTAKNTISEYKFKGGPQENSSVKKSLEMAKNMPFRTKKQLFSKDS